MPVCVRNVKGMVICALFGMQELNASNFQTSELCALNIEYFHYMHGKACGSSINDLCELATMHFYVFTSVFSSSLRLTERKIATLFFWHTAHRSVIGFDITTRPRKFLHTLQKIE